VAPGGAGRPVPMSVWATTQSMPEAQELESRLYRPGLPRSIPPTCPRLRARPPRPQASPSHPARAVGAVRPLSHWGGPAGLQVHELLRYRTWALRLKRSMGPDPHRRREAVRPLRGPDLSDHRPRGSLAGRRRFRFVHWQAAGGNRRISEPVQHIEQPTALLNSASNAVRMSDCIGSMWALPFRALPFRDPTPAWRTPLARGTSSTKRCGYQARARRGWLERRRQSGCRVPSTWQTHAPGGC